MSDFSGIRTEGGLFAPDLFDQLLKEELPGQKPRDFGFAGERGFTDEIAAVFADAQALWQVFQNRLRRLPEGELGTSMTRDSWVIPFLGLLDFELHYNRRAYVEAGLTFAISHRAGEDLYAPPVHIVGVYQELGRIAPFGRPRLAPHSLVQEFLNRTEALWGLVSNGRVLRLLRDSTYIRRQAYVEFDLEAIFDQRLFQDFVVLFRLLHRSRFPQTGSDSYQCLLEQYYQYSVEQGGRVRDRLRDGVEACIKHLANGFLAHPRNDNLRRRVCGENGDSDILTSEELYRELLRLVYRFLFLLVSEERGLISQNPLYLKHYSVSRLRRLVSMHTAYTEHHDLWLSLRVLWKLLSDGSQVQQLGDRPFASLFELPVLNGELFEPLILDNCFISNRDLLTALWHLVNYQDEPTSPPRRVNYAALDVEELGSVYESLLEYHPQIDTSGTTPRFDFVSGSERRSTGSYYTPAELVSELVRSALEPVIEERLKNATKREDKENTLLSIKVVDPAAGSGHFLLAAARRLGKELARIRTGEGEPAPERVREAKRDVVAHCIYGVDKNPLAVELCRVALWIEAHCENKPLTFLDHRIRCGDSLVGVFDLEMLKGGIPDDAFKPLSVDDRSLAASLKKRNRVERAGQRTMFATFDANAEVQDLSTVALAIDSLADDSTEAIQKKREYYSRLQMKAERDRTACDLWTAAFFQKRNSSTPKDAFITTDTLIAYLESGDVHPQAIAHAKSLAEKHRFFHWPLEFPEVFSRGGFDVVLGNPPWEQIQLEEQEFFSTRDVEIARASNAATRKRLIQKLTETNPELWDEYQSALHAIESVSRFLRGSSFYPLTGRGRINTYSVFAERMRELLRPGGQAGIVVPTGIAMADTNKYFFSYLVDNSALVSLYDFENREKIFPAIDSREKFCLLTLRKKQENNELQSTGISHFAFFCTRIENLSDARRVFTLSKESIAIINPNTRTLPVFRTRQDAELTKAIYERVPVLVNEKTGENFWNVTFKQGLFNMSSDSHLFRTYEQLENEGFRMVGNRFIKDSEVWLPLYEAKMIWHFDHRFGTYEGVTSRSSTHLPTPDESRHADPAFLAQPWYWVPAPEVEARLRAWNRNWIIGFRDVTNSTNERTAVFSVLPRVGIGNKVPIWIIDINNTMLISMLHANTSSLVFDYSVRQKLGGTAMNFFYVKQLPVLLYQAYKDINLKYIIPRVSELNYTSWDIKPFADDVWHDADKDIKSAIRAQWESNAAETGGHEWNLPEWIEAYPEIETDPQRGIPLPPFKWSETRRAILRAELDAYYARLYGLARKQLRYILDPADLTRKELEDILDPWEEVRDPLDEKGYAARVEESDFPGETFRVLKEKEIRQYGEYRTRRLVLEAWERLGGTP